MAHGARAPVRAPARGCLTSLTDNLDSVSCTARTSYIVETRTSFVAVKSILLPFQKGYDLIALRPSSAPLPLGVSIESVFREWSTVEENDQE